MIPWKIYERLAFERTEEKIEEKTFLVVDVDGLFWTCRYDGGIWRDDSNDSLNNMVEEVTHYAHINLPGEDKADA
ncbi:hypothetical protein KDC22_14375 [Paenibacillus tritici]|uniref:hypothetical protein n=1 Tax=Paenibacillus tritici TaxID=1873425 RepID=UPI001BA7E18C|nr:hypothetical protein [Paenibacillus tritici]QUL57552.1 hypothetical protein KDC22_14375 [Paenibacillus tritici]